MLLIDFKHVLGHNACNRIHDTVIDPAVRVWTLSVDSAPFVQRFFDQKSVQDASTVVLTLVVVLYMYCTDNSLGQG